MYDPLDAATLLRRAEKAEDRVASLEAALGILMNRHGTYCPRCDGDRREPHNEDVACTWCAGSGRWARTAQYREFTALREGSV